jgi:hypothetical protein
MGLRRFSPLVHGRAVCRWQHGLLLTQVAIACNALEATEYFCPGRATTRVAPTESRHVGATLVVAPVACKPYGLYPSKIEATKQIMRCHSERRHSRGRGILMRIHKKIPQPIEKQVIASLTGDQQLRFTALGMTTLFPSPNDRWQYGLLLIIFPSQGFP